MVVVVVGEYVCMCVWTLFMCTTLCRCLQREKRVSDPPPPATIGTGVAGSCELSYRWL